MRQRRMRNGLYTITRQEGRFGCPEFLLWHWDGELMGKFTDYDQAREEMDRFTQIDVQLGDADYAE